MSFLDETGLERLWTYIIAKLNGLVQSNRTINGKSLETDITLTASDVNADPTGTASEAVDEHNTSDTSHEDIRLLIDTKSQVQIIKWEEND